MQLTIHIGYPKCASTTLQKHFFVKHPQILFLGKYPKSNVGYDSKSEQPKLALPEVELSKLHNLILGKNSQDTEKELNSIYSILNSIYDNRVMVLSNEFITSSLFDKVQLQKKAKRISELFPNARIIIVARNPFSWLLSQYRDQPFHPENISQGNYVDFDEWIDALFTSRIDILKGLKYEEVYAYYQKLFTTNNILFLKIEDLKKNSRAFSDALCGFLNIDKEIGFNCLQAEHENVGTSKEFTKYRRTIRKYKPYLPKNSFTFSIKAKIDNVIKRLLPQKRREIDFKIETKKRIENHFSKTIDFLENQI